MTDGIIFACDVPVKRSVSADAAAQVRLDCFPEVGENMIYDVLVAVCHRIPLRIAWFSGWWQIRRVRVERIEPGIEGSRRTAEYFVVLLTVLFPEHVGNLKTAAVL